MRNRISSRLILAVAAVSVTTIGVFSYFLTNSQHQALISQVELSAHKRVVGGESRRLLPHVALGLATRQQRQHDDEQATYRRSPYESTTRDHGLIDSQPSG